MVRGNTRKSYALSSLTSMALRVLARRWCFTAPLEHRPVYTATKVDYLVFGEEKAPSTGFMHWQGYCEFGTGVSIPSAQKRLGLPNTVHFEKAKGNAEQNQTYCKEDGKWFEFGTIKKDGSRNDLKDAVERLKAGTTTYDDLVMDEPELVHTYGRTLKEVERVIMKRMPARTEPASVEVYTGVGGTGKSTAARSAAPTAYTKGIGSEKYFEEYECEETVIIEEMDFSMGIDFYKELIDLPKCRVRCLYGMKRFCAKRIIICSNTPLDEWFKWESVNNRNALFRRISEWREFNEDFTSIVKEVPKIKLSDRESSCSSIIGKNLNRGSTSDCSIAPKI